MLVLAPAAAGAQGAPVLVPKPSLSLPASNACLSQRAPSVSARRDEAGARTAAARARELGLVGDQAGARDAFARAAALDPLAPSYAYELGRASEELSDRAGALSAYCRYLALAPAGAESGEVRSRVGRLGAGGDATSERSARDAFARGVTALRAERWPQAVLAFDEVLRATPSAPEASYNRGLARLALGRDEEAARDLGTYVASPVAGADRAEVLRAISALQRPEWSAGGAFLRGLVVPGLGQMYTGRPVGGVVVLAATAGAAVFALRERTTVTQQEFRDPFGNPYTTPVRITDRPYLATGLAGAAVLVTGAALEASLYAARARGARPIVRVRSSTSTGSSTPAASSGTTVSVGLGLTF